MKRIIYAFIIVCLFLSICAFFIKPAIIFITKEQLKNVFIQSEVSVGGCVFKPARYLRLLNIEIKRGSVYDFKIKEINISYNPQGILRRKISKVLLKDLTIFLALPHKDNLKINDYLRLGATAPVFIVKNIELENLKLDLEAKNLSLNGSFSARINLARQELEFLDLKINSLDAMGVKLKNALVKARLKKAEYFSIESVKYNEARIEEIKGRLRLDEKAVFVDSLSAKIFDGQVEGDLSVNLAKSPEYLCHLKFENVDLDRITTDFKLKEKLQLSGKLIGDLVLKGSGANIQILGGDFSAMEPGGKMIITDDKMLKDIAKNSNQSMDILVESFKDYRYNTGIMKLSLEEGNLVFNVAMDGEAGKRNLAIVLHGFKLGSLGLSN